VCVDIYILCVCVCAFNLNHKRTLPATQRTPQPVGEAPSRSMATLKEVQNRIKTVKNIGQITLSMKTVASTKQKKAQDRFEVCPMMHCVCV
jgi:hypothetical protein